MTQHMATFITVDQELLRRALVVAQDCTELASEMLVHHDANFGRTTKKNQMWAAELEKAIVRADVAIVELRRALGWDKEVAG